MTKYQILFVAAAINMVITLGFVIVMAMRKQFAKGILVGINMVIVPVAGPLFILFSYVCSLILKCMKAAYIDLSEISFRRNKIKVIEGDSLERGMNKVPMEEALLASDAESVRRVLLDVLKSDLEGSVSILMKAIESDDSEASHYASTAIAEVLSKFKSHQKELDAQYHRHMDDGELLTAYHRYVYKYLSFHIFPQAEEKRYMELCRGLMERAYEDFPKMDAQDYENWILLLLEKGEKEKAEEWLFRMKKDYPESLPTFRAELSFYYRYDHEEFGRCLQRIKNSRIMLDEDTLAVVRFFQEA